MKTCIVLLTLLALPLAAASGPTTTVATLTHSDGCTSSGGSWAWSPPPSNESPPTSGSYGYSEWRRQQCAAESDTASLNASDDAGTLAAARLFSANGSESDDHHVGYSSWEHNGSYDYNYYYQSGSDQFASHQERGAEATVLDARTFVGDSCSSTYSGSYERSYSYSSSPSESSGGSHERGQRSGTYSCGEGATSSKDGRSADAFVGGRCAGSASDEKYAYSSSSSSTQPDNGTTYSGYEYARRSSSDADGCASGAFASADGQSFFAGREDACSSSSDAYTDASYGPSGSYNRNSTYSTSRCYHGYVVEGPDGMRLTAGNETQHDSYCYHASNEPGNCNQWDRSNQGVYFAWADSPVSGLSYFGAEDPTGLALLG